MREKFFLKNLLIILLVCILTIIPWASVTGIQDPVLLEVIREFQHIAFFVIVTSILLKIFYDLYMKPLGHQIKEEEIKELDQKDEKPLLFKPSVGVVIFLISFFALGTIFGLINPKLNFIYTIIGIMFVIFFIWLWYTMPVFIFTDDSVQIKSHLFYLFGFDRKTIIRYADIISMSPDAESEGYLNMLGLDRRHRIVISMNGKKYDYHLVFFNPDVVAKIYLRFKEKLGDKVKLE